MFAFSSQITCLMWVRSKSIEPFWKRNFRRDNDFWLGAFDGDICTEVVGFAVDFDALFQERLLINARPTHSSTVQGLIPKHLGNGSPRCHYRIREWCPNPKHTLSIMFQKQQLNITQTYHYRYTPLLFTMSYNQGALHFNHNLYAYNGSVIFIIPPLCCLAQKFAFKN